MEDRTYVYDAPCARVKCRCGLEHPLTEPGREAAQEITDAERADGWTALYLATVRAPFATTVVRVLARRAEEEIYGRAWMVRVESPDVRPPLPLAARGEWEAALWSVLAECARWQWRLVSLVRAPAPSRWVPWPTSTGYWWARERPGAPLCVVEARVEAESSWIYFTGIECPLYASEPREAWEFCPAEPPR